MGYRARQQGMTLIIVMVFLAIITGLIISSLETSTLEVQMTANWRDTQQNFAIAESALREAEAILAKGKTFDCLVPLQSESDLHKRNWLSSPTCLAISGHARFIVELLDIDPCVQIMGSDNKGVAYYRISAHAVGEEDQSNTLQTIYAQPALAYQECTENKNHVIKAGRQAWREIS